MPIAIQFLSQETICLYTMSLKAACVEGKCVFHRQIFIINALHLFAYPSKPSLSLFALPYSHDK